MFKPIFLVQLMYEDPRRHSLTFQSYVQLTMTELHVKKPSSSKVDTKVEYFIPFYLTITLSRTVTDSSWTLPKSDDLPYIAYKCRLIRDIR